MTWTPAFAINQATAADAAFHAGTDLGPLQGIPVSVKDLFGVAGLPTYAGSPRQLPIKWQREGPLIRRLRAQLGVIVGKTHTVEFAFGGLGTNAHWGAPRNAFDWLRVPGGSSSGAAISVAEGSAMLAFGTDTAGSARVPASMNALAGLKTTKGRWSMDGIVPLSPSLDTPGLIARSASDLAYAFAAVDGTSAASTTEMIPPVPSSSMKLGIPERFFWSDCSPGVLDTIEIARRRIEAAGTKVEAADLPGCEEADELFRIGGLAAPELDRFLTDELPEWRASLDPVVQARMRSSETLGARAYLQRQARLQALAHSAAVACAEVDAFITPTVAITPPRLDDIKTPEDYGPLNLLALRNTAVVNCLKLCAATIPVGRDAVGMPVGLQLIAAPGREERLLAILQAIEQLLRGVAED